MGVNGSVWLRRSLAMTNSLIVAAALLGCSGDPSTADSAALDTRVRELRASVRCSDDVPLRGDPYFWDHMRGVDCWTADGDPLFIRAYSHPESVPQVLQDWAGTFVDGRTLVHGRGWFAVGPASALRDVTGRDGSGPTTAVPTATALTTEREEQTTCVRFLSGTVDDAVHNEAQFEDELPKLDRIYPGSEAAVREVLGGRTIARLQSTPPAAFTARLGDFADRLNAVCASAVSKAHPGIHR